MPFALTGGTASLPRRWLRVLLRLTTQDIGIVQEALRELRRNHRGVDLEGIAFESSGEHEVSVAADPNFGEFPFDQPFDGSDDGLNIFGAEIHLYLADDGNTRPDRTTSDIGNMQFVYRNIRYTEIPSGSAADEGLVPRDGAPEMLRNDEVSEEWGERRMEERSDGTTSDRDRV